MTEIAGPEVSLTFLSADKSFTTVSNDGGVAFFAIALLLTIALLSPIFDMRPVSTSADTIRKLLLNALCCLLSLIDVLQILKIQEFLFLKSRFYVPPRSELYKLVCFVIISFNTLFFIPNNKYIQFIVNAKVYHVHGTFASVVSKSNQHAIV